MKMFLQAWARGVGIFAFYFCLTIVIAVLGFFGQMVTEILPWIISVPLLIIFGPVAIYWASRWLAPDLFTDFRGRWRKTNWKKIRT